MLNKYVNNCCTTVIDKSAAKLHKTSLINLIYFLFLEE